MGKFPSLTVCCDGTLEVHKEYLAITHISVKRPSLFGRKLQKLPSKKSGYGSQKIRQYF
jgi:hypothetical protein